MSNLSNAVREALGDPVSGSAVSETLTAHDRCDVRDCGAQALVRAVYVSGDLLFCGHHFAANEDAVVTTAGEIHDERLGVIA